MNYYEILEVSETASAEVIKASYRALVRKFHPDVYVGDKGYATEQLKVLNAAYEVLSDPIKRRIYDDYLKSGFYKPDANRSQRHYERDENQNQKSKGESNKAEYSTDSEKSGGKDTSNDYQSSENTEGIGTQKRNESESKQTKHAVGIVVAILIIIATLAFGLYYMQSSIKQKEMQEQKEAAIQSYEENEESVLGAIFLQYPTEGDYLFKVGADLEPGIDENYDRLHNQMNQVDDNLRKEDPQKYARLMLDIMNSNQKYDVSGYNNYFEMLKEVDPDEYEKIKANDYLNWQTRQTSTIKTTYGWRGIQVEYKNDENPYDVYYVEFAFDTINTDMSDGYTRYAFEVSRLPKVGQSSVHVINYDESLQDKYSQYYDNVW